jgi:diadenosine tetraphosphate (Ap4A) HIT family hydrolase
VTGDCPFCEPPDDEVLDRDGPVFARRVVENHLESAMVIPAAHRTAPWELTADEWSATQRLLTRLRARYEASHAPDGWNVGWNVGPVGGQTVEHAHCHLVPRYADEPFARRGIRWWFKQPENARP